jgi:hypothetical protein
MDADARPCKCGHKIIEFKEKYYHINNNYTNSFEHLNHMCQDEDCSCNDARPANKQEISENTVNVFRL